MLLPLQTAALEANFINGAATFGKNQQINANAVVSDDKLKIEELGRNKKLFSITACHNQESNVDTIKGLEVTYGTSSDGATVPIITDAVKL